MNHTDAEIIGVGLTVLMALLRLEHRLTKLETLMDILRPRRHSERD